MEKCSGAYRCDGLQNAIVAKAIKLHNEKPEVVSPDDDEHYPLIFCPFCGNEIGVKK